MTYSAARLIWLLGCGAFAVEPIRGRYLAASWPDETRSVRRGELANPSRDPGHPGHSEPAPPVPKVFPSPRTLATILTGKRLAPSAR